MRASNQSLLNLSLVLHGRLRELEVTRPGWSQIVVENFRILHVAANRWFLTGADQRSLAKLILHRRCRVVRTHTVARWFAIL